MLMLLCMDREMLERRRKEIGLLIRRAREAAGLNQEGIGRHFDVSGSAISNWEAGKVGIEIAILEELARLYRQPLQSLTGQAVPRRDTEAEAIGKDVLKLVQRHGYSNVRRVDTYRGGEAGQVYPVRGRIPASDAAAQESQSQEIIFIPDALTEGCQEVIIFYVAGDCLRDEGIRLGDHLIIDGARKEPQNGDIVAAVVNRNETAKLYFQVGDHIELRPASPGYDTIVVHEGDELEIIGIFHNVYPTGKRGRR